MILLFIHVHKLDPALFACAIALFNLIVYLKANRISKLLFIQGKSDSHF